MSTNPISRTRLAANTVIVVLTATAILGAIFGFGPPGIAWAWIIGGTACALTIIQLVMHFFFPDAAKAAWDELNQTAHDHSIRFGYWATLLVFIVLLALVLGGQIDPAWAFYWMGPVLGVVPSAHFLWSVARGRAE